MKRISILCAGALLGCVIGCGSADSSSSGSQSSGLTVSIAGSTAPFDHQDGASGQTAQNVTAGVRSLTLLTADGTAFTLMDQAPNAVTVGYDDGDETPVAHLDPAAIVPGHYVQARLVQDWSRFDVSATLHQSGATTNGTLHALQVTSDGAMVNGVEQQAGHYEQAFDGGGKTQDFAGDDAIVPEHSSTPGAQAVVENALWSVYFPVDLELEPHAAALRVVVNMDRAFRWDDVPGGQNQPGVYDIAPPIYEPVRQFGGNRFDVTVESR
jgi:hypothetical protein